MSEEGKTDYFHYLADDLMKVKRYDDAIKLYEKLVDLHPGEDSFLLSLAWAYHDSGRLADAVDCFERLLNVELKQEVFTGFAFDELVRIFKEKGEYNRLVDVCKKVVAAQPDDTALLSELGDAYLKAGRASEAVGVFEKIVEVEQDASAAYCNLGNALVATGNFDGAEEAYRKAVEIDPSEAGSFYNKLAYVYFDAGHDKRAEMAFRRGLEFRIDEPMYHCGLGDVLVRLGKINDANDEYDKAVDLNRASSAAYYNRFGNTLARESYHLQAIEAFKKAIAADPKNPFYYVRLAESYTAIERPDMAEKICRQVESLK
ncbi:MAG TPA: tetratricopeptide repeat protein [Syntrophales bacterium]|nr:tetratricopeptide repeat protein [Syntrophales bacterium]